MNGWIGVDLDGTLARYPSPGGHFEIGDPLEPMLRRVQGWLDQGIEVRIFTARASVAEEIPLVEAWVLRHLGRPLRVTNAKDFGMIQLWDDRAIQVRSNVGEPLLAVCDPCLLGSHGACAGEACRCDACR